MKNRLRALVDQVLPDVLTELKVPSLKPHEIPYEVEWPKVKAHGDLSVNLAFQLGRELKQSPMDIARTCQRILSQKIRQGKEGSPWIEEITVARPGFINFKLTNSSIAKELLEIHRLDQEYGRSDLGRGAKVLIEFVSANPTGPLTIAHGRQAAIGDTLARILKVVAFQPHKEFYLNDMGRQIRLLGESLWARYQQLFGRKAELPEEGYEGDYLVELARRLKDEIGDRFLKQGASNNLAKISEYGIQSILSETKKDLSAMRVEFDEYFSEQSLEEAQLIDHVLDALKVRGCVYEADGALWFRATRFGDDKDRVLKKQTGEYTYLSSDIAYHESKFRRGYDRLINLWGPDHHGYIARVHAACQALGYSRDRLKILIVQLTTLYRHGELVRMSTRKGEFVTLRQLLDEVGVDATRFFFLMRKVESHLDFDLELATRKSDENPVYYVQYAYARISSILSYAKQKVTADVDLDLLREPEALDLIKKMVEYPDVLQQAADHLEPYRVVDYLRELATAFHKFYTTCRVVTQDEPLTKTRLLLTDSVRIVLRSGLEILGVSAPTSM
ncbi:MAG: arginine--tRNA ligase [Omnitrophica bacterium RIFCSPLOWO2_12_FULL_50_11]|nr:MAG: arginine--tRNA ligase [Omnitrophica bacterium RIFCSPLOWO2_12_FULL_50_11]